MGVDMDEDTDFYKQDTKLRCLQAAAEAAWPNEGQSAIVTASDVLRMAQLFLDWVQSDE